MREIKFRAWDTKRNQFVDEGEICFCFYGDTRIEVHPNSQNYIGDDVHNGEPQGNRFIIEQFTGLKDKNGKEIYEGDFLRYPGDDTNFTAYEVFFHDGDANSDYNIGWSINRTHHQGNICGGFIPSFKPKTTKQMVICGNIHENPELLNQ